ACVESHTRAHHGCARRVTATSPRGNRRRQARPYRGPHARDRTTRPVGPGVGAVAPPRPAPPRGRGGAAAAPAVLADASAPAITLARDVKEVGYADLAGAKDFLESKDAPTLAMTFPGGTHDIWLRYWLLATKADTSRVKISPVPPPQMVQNMSVGNVQGYCVG